MIHRLAAAGIFSLIAFSALAQEPSAPAPGTRCTGVLCDLYYASRPTPAPGQPETPDPTHLPCHDFLCAAFGGRTPEAPPPPAQQVVAPEPAAPAHPARRKHVAHKSASDRHGAVDAAAAGSATTR